MRLLTVRKKLLPSCAAWSLLELLVVLAIMALLVAATGPKLHASWRLQQLHDERQRLVQSLRYARLTSLQTNTKISLCWAPACGTSNGLLVYRDDNGDGQWQASETSIASWQMPAGLRLKFNRPAQISFNNSGNTAQTGTLVLCASGVSSGLSVVLSSNGRVRLAEASCE
jgi:Tfp pilus assembly protein FimT